MVSKRPEHEVLFSVTQRELDAGQAKFRQLLSQVEDWEYLIAAASYHGLVPLLHKHLHSLDADLVPINVHSRLRRQSVSNSQNVLHLMSKQLKVHRLLKDSGVPVAVFKGSVLSQMSYGEISLRTAGDIDLLIAPRYFTQTRVLLESLGYEMTPQLTPAPLDSHLKHHCEIQFVRDDWFTVVDLHWALAPKSFVFNLKTDDVMSRLQTVVVGGAEIQTLATEDLILYLSMHGAKHLWRALEWISSLGELIRSSESIDWDVVIERAVQSHATRMLGLALRLVEHVSELGIVSQVAGAIDKDESMRRMAEQVLAQMFVISGKADSTETNLYNLKIMDRKRDVLISAMRAIFIPTFTDWDALPLPSPLHSLYYAWRPLRLSKVYGASLVGKGRRLLGYRTIKA